MKKLLIRLLNKLAMVLYSASMRIIKVVININNAHFYFEFMEDDDYE